MAIWYCMYVCMHERVLFSLWYFVVKESSSQEEPLSIEESKELMGRVAQLQLEKSTLEEKVHTYHYEVKQILFVLCLFLNLVKNLLGNCIHFM